MEVRLGMLPYDWKELVGKMSDQDRICRWSQVLEDITRRHVHNVVVLNREGIQLVRWYMGQIWYRWRLDQQAGGGSSSRRIYPERVDFPVRIGESLRVVVDDYVSLSSTVQTIQHACKLTVVAVSATARIGIHGTCPVTL